MRRLFVVAAIALVASGIYCFAANISQDELRQMLPKNSYEDNLKMYRDGNITVDHTELDKAMLLNKEQTERIMRQINDENSDLSKILDGNMKMDDAKIKELLK